MFVSIFCVLCALVLSITSSFTFWQPTIWYEFYRPLVMFIAGYFAGLAFVWIFIDISSRIISNKKKNYTKPSNFARFLLTQGMFYIDCHANVRLKKIGLDKIPNQPFLLVCNHKSKFDPMIAAAVFRKIHLAFITKDPLGP